MTTSTADPQTAANYLNFINYAYTMYEKHPDSLTPPTPHDFPANYKISLYLTAEDPWTLPPYKRVFYGFLAAADDPSLPDILAVRGTEGLPEWINDFDVIPTSFTVPDSYIAGGFSNIFTSLAWRFPNGDPAELDSSLASTNAGVVFAGHSLGGAIVTMIALNYWYFSAPSAPFAIYTAASPAVGCTVFAQAFNELVPNSSRYINEFDGIASALDVLYTQVNGDGIELGSVDVWPTPGCEHSLETYLWLIDPAGYSLPSDCSWTASVERENFIKVVERRRLALSQPQPV